MKIDVTKIAGYDEMSAEDKIKALEAYEDDFNEDSYNRLKDALSKSNSESAKWKKALQEKQTEQERLEMERKEQEEALKNELAELRKEKALSTNKANFLSVGYSDALAESSANAIVNGDVSKVFTDLKMFIEELKKTTKSELLNQQPNITPGQNPNPELQKQKELEMLKKYAGLK